MGCSRRFPERDWFPAEVVADPSFAIAVALAAGLTVLLATRLGFPISTTHALIGALVGAGLVASPTGIYTDQLMRGLLLPLLVSPILAIAGAALLYPAFRWARLRLGVEQETCVCVGEQVVGVVAGSLGREYALNAVSLPKLEAGDRATCRVQYDGRVMGVEARPALDAAHFLSAGAVSFARGLNDTPKIAALLLVGGALSPTAAIVGVGVAIAVGGLVAARRVAETMARRVTAMNPGQGFAANLVTALLVIGASRLGVPVSTTHVSCGSLFGIGTVTGQARWNTIVRILLAWAITLPLAGGLSALAMLVS